MSEQTTNGSTSSPETTSNSTTPSASGNAQQASAMNPETPKTSSQETAGQQGQENQGQSNTAYQSVLDVYRKQQADLAKQKAKESQAPSYDPAKPNYQPSQHQFNNPSYNPELLPQQLGQVQPPQLQQPLTGYQQMPALYQQPVVDWSYGAPRLADGSLLSPPSENDPSYESFLEWSLRRPDQFLQYGNELNRQALKQEWQQTEHQRQLEIQQEQLKQQEAQYYEQMFTEYESELTEILKTDYHPGLVENPELFNIMKSLSDEVVDLLPTNEYNQAWNVAENRPYTNKEVTDIAFQRFCELYEYATPIMQSRGQVQGQVPPQQLMTTAQNLAAPIGQSRDLEAQILQARAQGNHDLARKLQWQALFPNQ